MLSDVFSNSSYYINAIGEFEGITTSYAVIKFSLASTKTKRVVKTI
jgi:hypothetical protein